MGRRYNSDNCRKYYSVVYMVGSGYEKPKRKERIGTEDKTGEKETLKAREPCKELWATKKRRQSLLYPVRLNGGKEDLQN